MDYAMLVRERAAEMGIDPDLAVRQMMAESSGNPNAVSPAGAVGLMQLMPATAQELGVDPRDPIQNIEGGLRYYKQMLDRFGGDPRLALAAYNAGPGNVQKYGGIPPFKETQNYVNKLAPVQTAQANTGTTSDAPPAEAPAFNPSIDQIISALDKAKAANDKEAIEELRSFATPKFQSALSRAQEANDNEAVEEIRSIGSRYGFIASDKPKPAEKESFSNTKALLGFLGDVGLGAADALSFGFADEGYAKAASAIKGTNYEDELKAARGVMDDAGAGKYVGQAASFLVPGIGAVRAANTASRLGRAGVGAATGAGQGALYGAGSAEGDLADRAAGAAVGGTTGLVLGGALGAVLPSTVRQEANKIVKGAGSNRAAAMDAEIIQDINKVAGNATQRGAPVGATQLNAVENQYIGDVNIALKNIGKKTLEKLGLKADDITVALRDRRIIGADELDKLRTTKAGTALADSIEKAQRARSLTAPVPAAGGLARIGRTVLDLAPIPQPLRYAGQSLLGSRKTREQVAGEFINPKTLSAAEEVLTRTGPSAATQSLQRLQQQAQKATTAAQARQAAMQAQKAAQQAQRAATRNQTLAQTRTPLGGSFQELLPGGRAGTNLQSREAINALRILRGQGGPVGDAAEQILKSRNVADPNAFYGLQNQLRRLQEAGRLPGGAPVAQAAGPSGIRNPISYAEAVRTAGEAANIARASAPNKGLAQFATKVAGTKNPSDKAKLVSERLAKATDQGEIDYLNTFVVPLTQFGAK
jgi:hypothetical protein